MSLVEALAVLEHQQWNHWIAYQLEHMHLINWERWTRQARIPYAMLSEKEKESDREWARKVLAVIDKSHILISREKLQELFDKAMAEPSDEMDKLDNLQNIIKRLIGDSE